MGGVAHPQAVLFACRLNTIRSPIAASLAMRLFPGMYVASAGVLPGDPDPMAAAVMEEIGIDLSHHRPTSVDDLEDSNFDLIVTLSPEAHHKALEMTRSLAVAVEYWPTPDPSATEGSREQVLAAYRDVRNMLEARIRERFAWTPTPSG